MLLNELNTKKFSHFRVASKNWTLNAAAAAAARKKFDGGLTGLSTTSTPRKLDSVAVVSRIALYKFDYYYYYYKSAKFDSADSAGV